MCGACDYRYSLDLEVILKGASQRAVSVSAEQDKGLHSLPKTKANLKPGGIRSILMTRIKE